MLIDPVKGQVGARLQLLRDRGLTLTAALDTHVHADHITGLGALREATGCRSWMGEQSAAPCVSARFGEGSEIAFGRHRLRALYTPGHADDSYCFLLEADGQRYAFAGDTLLIRGTGPTDFQNGSAHEQYHSLFTRLMTLPDDERVYPGPDYRGWTVSSIGEERTCNPRLQVKDEASYVEQMDSLRLPNPRWM